MSSFSSLKVEVTDPVANPQNVKKSTLFESLKESRSRQGGAVVSTILVERFDRAISQAFAEDALDSDMIYKLLLATKKLSINDTAETERLYESAITKSAEYQGTRPQEALKKHRNAILKFHAIISKYIQADRERAISWANLVRTKDVQMFLKDCLTQLIENKLEDKKILHSKALWMTATMAQARSIFHIYTRTSLSLVLRFSAEAKINPEDYVPLSKESRDILAGVITAACDKMVLVKVQERTWEGLSNGTSINDLASDLQALTKYKSSELVAFLPTFVPLHPTLLKQASDYRQSKSGTKEHDDWTAYIASCCALYYINILPSSFKSEKFYGSATISIKATDPLMQGSFAAFQYATFVIRQLTRKLFPNAGGPATRANDYVIKTPDFILGNK